MPTSKPTTRTPTTISHHGLPSGGGTLSGVGRTMFSGLTAGARSGVGRAKPCFTSVPPTLLGSYRSEGCHDAPAHRRAKVRGPVPAAATRPTAPDSAGTSTPVLRELHEYFPRRSGHRNSRATTVIRM